MVGVSVVGGGVNKRISTLLHYTHQPYHPTVYRQLIDSESLGKGEGKGEG